MSPDENNAENSPKRISVRHRRQAMDWSLVLASQGLESSIIHDDQGWALLVEEALFEKAWQSITLYQKENRRWRWRQPLGGSGLIFHWGSLVWCFCLCWIFVWSDPQLDRLQGIAFMDNQAVSAGQWWRIFTAMTLHADIAHLAANVTTGVLLLGFAMARFGAGTGLLAAYLAGAGGNLAAYFIYGPVHRGIGASGMVMGALGLLAIHGISGWRKYPLAMRLMFRTLASAFFLFVIMGTNPNSDLVAHLGGFCFGVLFSALLSFVKKERIPRNVDRAFLFAVPVWVLVTWWFVFNSNLIGR